MVGIVGVIFRFSFFIPLENYCMIQVLASLTVTDTFCHIPVLRQSVGATLLSMRLN